MTSTNTLMDSLGAVPPALQKYSQNVLIDDLWHRPQLSPRDRSIVTLATLIARGNIGLFTPT